MKKDTMKLYFPVEGRVSGELIYEKGETYEIPIHGGSADRWIKRGAIPQSQMPKEEAKAIVPDLDQDDKTSNEDKNEDVPKSGNKNKGNRK